MNALGQLDLRPGDWVEVRSEEEILATLDDTGALDGLIFMPEMLPYCGRRFHVHKRADKTCDTIHLTGMLRMDNTVHLRMLRCNGAAHGGCQAACLFFWKEAWLRRASGQHDQTAVTSDAASTQQGVDRQPRDRAWLENTTVRPVSTSDETHYRCQATEIKNASCRLRWWEPMQYVRDIRTNREPPRAVLRSLAILVFNKVLRRISRWQFPDVAGKLKRTPVEVLDLELGEWAVVKSREEIVATLNASAKNRGMSFEAEMLPYCGKCFRVVHRVDQIIEEGTGRMKKLGSVGIILEGVICASAYRTPCPRANYLYWREIWLRRAEPHEIPQPAETGGLCVLDSPCG